MESRVLFEEAIEKGEQKKGSIEFKEQLDPNFHLVDERRQSLVAQLRHRVLSGEGEATYIIGVTDDGDIKGISEEAFSDTISVLSDIASEADAHISNTESFTVNNSSKLVGMITIEEGIESNIRVNNHLVVGTAGHVDHGKSTLVGSLVTGSSDNGKGKLRSYLDVQPHEIKRGLSADLSYAVYGFDNTGSALRTENPSRNQDRSDIVKNASRVVSFVDTVGHKPWLSTTIRGLVGQRLDYGLLAISATKGPTETTKEHLGVMLAMELPTIVAITKTDLVDEDRVSEVEREIEKLLREVNCVGLSAERYELDTIKSEIDSSTVPIVQTSAVSGTGIDTLDKLFRDLPKQKVDDVSKEFQMYIDKRYLVDGVGTVASGTIKSGSLEAGDTIYVGPTADGEYIETKARSIEIHYHRVNEASSGELVSVALQNVKKEDLKRGMIITKDPPTPTKRFKADVMILNHPTSISDGYEPVIHLETISESVMLDLDGSQILPGDTGEITVEFKSQPFAIEEGQRFIFREGESKGVGTVKECL